MQYLKFSIRKNSLIILSFFILAFAGCSKGGDSPAPTPPPVVITESDLVFRVDVAGSEVNYASVFPVVGTSLVIIAAKSLIGFFGEGGEGIIDWMFLFKVSAFAIVGIFIGTALSKRINGATLKPAFGWFVLVMGVYIILKETIL